MNEPAQTAARPTDDEIASWVDGFIRKQAYNYPVAVQIATEAAEWVRATLSDAPAVKYVPVDSNLRDGNWNHPNDDEPCDPECRKALDDRGDDRGQGLDGYWKWGFRAGWNAALSAAAPAATPPNAERAVPAGWKLVPVEPTQEMVNAGRLGWAFGIPHAWSEMLAAAPIAPTPPEQPEPSDNGEGPLRQGWQVSIGPGHAGFGVYAHMTEYPEEGAVCLCTIDPRDHKQSRADAKDAGRYRWLRSQDWFASPLCVVRSPKQAVKPGQDCPSLSRLDAAIDAAMLAATPTTSGDEQEAKVQLTMRISHERTGRCFWHLNCKAQRHAPPMKIERDDIAKKETLLRCTACGEAGWYPHGSVGEVCCEPESLAAAPPEQGMGQAGGEKDDGGVEGNDGR